ncbi:DNA-binding protein [Vibrio cholerae]|uniref:helix-turn-helix transcriptional regulator n=1 Tax=Vibrio cholerae TaxID=666 RepID=UPI0006637596|nr:DNA-binding protein [Vibrio cholerae]CSD55676.1 DNA-binding protein [Vibrio cholerae]
MTAVAHQVTPFLTSYEVMARYHISYTTLWRRIKDGSLPQPRINRNTRNKLLPCRSVSGKSTL